MRKEQYDKSNSETSPLSVDYAINAQLVEHANVSAIATSTKSAIFLSSTAIDMQEVKEQQVLQRNPDFVGFLHYALSTRSPLENPLWSFAMLTPVALASMWMYIIPSWKAGQAEGGLPMAILQLLGNTSGAGLVVYNIGGHYIDLIKASRDALYYLKTHGLIDRKSFHEVSGRLNKCCQSFVRGGKNTIKMAQEFKLDILIVSTIVSVPLAAAAWFYKDYETEPVGLLLTKSVVTLAVNTLIHTLPVTFILGVPWLNTLLIKAPMSPFILLRYLYRKCAWSKEEHLQYNSEWRLTMEQQALRANMMNGFYALIEQMQKFGFKRNGCAYAPMLDKNVMETLLKKVKRQQLGEQDVALILSLLPTIADAYAPPVVVNKQRSMVCCFAEYLNIGLQKIAGLGGAVLVGGSVAGYVKVNYDLYNEKLGSQVGAALLVAPTIIAMEVLCGYFGWVAFAGAYDFISNLVMCRPKMPYVFKLNPILSGLFLSITWTLGYFGYGTALQLVHDTFDPKIYGKVLCDLLAISAKYGIIVYGFINFAQLVEKLVEPVVKWKYCGSKEKQQYLFVLDTLRRLAALVDTLKPEALQEIINTIEDPRILKNFGLVKVVNGQGITITQVAKPTEASGSQEKAQSTQSWGGLFKSGCSFFSRCCVRSAAAAEERQPLINEASLKVASV